MKLEQLKTVYRRRIKTEEKAKVVAAAAWGTESIQFIALLARCEE